MLRSSQGKESPWVRGAIALFALATCIRVWVGPTEIVKRANAQLPDPALQRRQALEETRRTNQLLTEIKQQLETKVLNVRIVGADNKAGTPPAPARAGR